MVAEFRAARERTGNDVMLWMEAINLFWLGRDREALHVLDTNRRGAYADFLRVSLLREVSDDKSPALAALNQISVRDGDSTMWKRRHTHLIFLGEPEAAAREARAFRDGGGQLFWYPRELAEVLLNYYAEDGRATEEDLIRACRGRRTLESDCCHAIGLRHLAAGDRAGATAWFRRTADTLAVSYGSWEYSLAYLARMARDPNWPRWIPAQK
jgi:hypothetical protein